MTVYTDGSGINGKIGAAAWNATINEASHQHLGDEIQYNVYSAELSVIHIAFMQWKVIKNQFSICRIYSHGTHFSLNWLLWQREP